MIYTAPGQAGALVSFKSVMTTSSVATGWRRAGRYFENISPVDGGCSARWPAPTPPTSSSPWTRPTRRSPAGARPASPSAATCCCASPIASNRTLKCSPSPRPGRTAGGARDPGRRPALVVDHFRYFAGCIRAQEGSAAELDQNTVSYHFKGAHRRGRPDHPVELPLLMAAWKLAPVLAGRLLQRAQARRADPGHHHADDGSHQDILPPAWSTWSTASAPRQARRSPPATGSRSWRLPAPPRWAPISRAAPPTS